VTQYLFLIFLLLAGSVLRWISTRLSDNLCHADSKGIPPTGLGSKAGRQEGCQGGELRDTYQRRHAFRDVAKSPPKFKHCF